MALIPRLAETIDGEMIRQKLARQYVIDLDPESLAISTINHIADTLEAEGWISPARWLRSEAKA